MGFSSFACFTPYWISGINNVLVQITVPLLVLNFEVPVVYMSQFTCLSPRCEYVHVLEILRGFMSWDHCASTQVRKLYLFHNQQVVPVFHLSLTPTPPPSHIHTKSQKYNPLNTCFLSFFFFLLFLLSRPFGNTIFTVNRS